MASIGYGQSGRRGRHAAEPRQIPAPGWKDVLLRTFNQINSDRVTLVAAGATYFLLLSLFPAVTAFVSLYGLFADPAIVSDNVETLSTIVPAGGLGIIHDQLTRVTEQGAPTLGFAFALSMVIALWSASAGVRTLFEAMNIAYGETEKRNFFWVTALAIIFTIVGLVGALLMFVVVLAIPTALSFVGLGKGVKWLVQGIGYLILILALLGGISALYRFGPSRRQARWRWITPGAVFAVVVIAIVSALFSWYAANIGHFDKTYGSLGALIGFLFWMWVSLCVVLVGAELDSEMEHQTARDSTIGPHAPMGDRNAMMADTLGEPAGQVPDDDPRAGQSRDWVQGYEAAAHRPPGELSSGPPLRYAIPALLFGWLRRRR